MSFRACRQATGRPVVIGLFCALLLISAPSIRSAADADDPMRTEDVVRMLVRGVADDEILVAIRSRPAVFDLSEEMQEELRRAGVSDDLIQAMIDRMAELAPKPGPADEPDEGTQETEPVDPALRVWLDPQRKDGKPEVLRIKGVVDFQMRQAWQLDAETEGTPFENVAIFLVCRSATHVPDHWRSKSPLGRDFISMPRHRMLVFLTATEEGSEDDGDGPLELELPASLEVEIPLGEPHDLSLGVAVQTEGRYLRLTDDSWNELGLEPGGTEIRAEIRGAPDGRLNEVEVRFERGASPAAQD